MESWEEKWKNFIDRSKYPVQTILREISLSKLENYWGKGQVPETVLDRYIAGERKDFILENLQTHDWKQLAKALTREFGFQVKVRPFEDNSEKSFVFVDVTGTKEKPATEILKSFREGRGRDILQFFNYSLSGIERNRVSLEPKWSESGTEYIYNKCFGVVWHLCPEELADDVFQAGLRCRNRDDSETRDLRNYPKRIYVYATEPLPKSQLRDRLEDLADTISEGNLTLEDYQVFKIQLPRTGFSGKIEFYSDSAIADGHTFYTYTNIPASLLKPVEF